MSSVGQAFRPAGSAKPKGLAYDRQLTVVGQAFRPAGLAAFALVSVLAVAVGASQTLSPQDALLARLAIDLAADRDAAPISLDADGSRHHGVVYDRFTLAHLAARVAKLRGTPFNPEKPAASLFNKLLTVVAVPVPCGGRMVRPTDVDIIGSDGRAIQKWAPQSGAAAQAVLPGARVPGGAIAVTFADTVLRQEQVIRISYAVPVCPGTEPRVTLPVTMTTIRARERPTIEVARGQAPPTGTLTLTIQGIVDLEGQLRYATAPESNTELGAAAFNVAVKTAFEPARINGSPSPWTGGVILDFQVVTPAGR